MPVQRTSRLPPLQGFTAPAVKQHVSNVHRELQILHERISALEGHRGTTTFNDHVDLGGNRMTNVGATRSDLDAPNVRELRAQAMYNRNGVHEASGLILARHGIRTKNPALARDDLVPLGQLADILVANGLSLAGGASQPFGGSGGTITTLTLGVAFPPVTITLVNGPNVDIDVGNSVFVRIDGPTAAFSIGGFANPVGGRLLYLYQITAQTMTILHEDPFTTAAFRIHSGSGGDLMMDGPGLTTFLFDDIINRWITA